MKKLIIAIVIAAGAASVWAGPCGGRGCGGGACRPCRPCRPGWRCPPPSHRDWWGRGGCNFWPSFIGGVVGGIACNAVARPCYGETVVVQSAPTVVTQLVVVQQPMVVTQPVVRQTVVSQPARVWVEGCYVDQVQANGSVVRVWQAGHYE